MTIREIIEEDYKRYNLGGGGNNWKDYKGFL